MKKKISLSHFIKDYRKEIDGVILKHCPNMKISDKERRLWVLNYEYLYLLAKDKGVNI